MITHYADIAPYITKDGSEIRELMHPTVHGNRRQSLAEAVVAPGAATRLHRHRSTEEIYHITAGNGLLTLADEELVVQAGDTICIPPGTPHRIRNNGDRDLSLLCSCTPPYSDEDTELL